MSASDTIISQTPIKRDLFSVISNIPLRVGEKNASSVCIAVFYYLRDSLSRQKRD